MNNKLTAINVKLTLWQDAYQQIRRVDNWMMAYLTSGITPAKAEQAITDAHELADLLRQLADTVERQAEHAAAIVDTADGFTPAPVDLLPCPFCNATEHETDAGDWIPAIQVSQPLAHRPNHYEAECLECGEAWSITESDNEYPAILDDVYQTRQTSDQQPAANI